MNRTEIADHIASRLTDAMSTMATHWQSSGKIRHCFVDDVLPVRIAQQICSAFPIGSEMQSRRTLREFKHVAAQMDQYDSILEEAVYAFQDPRVVALVGEITGLQALEPDALLYAGGISMMSKGHFLNPHIDNSHDKGRELYRVLNLLYYVSPDWKRENGGNLEVWPNGVRDKQVTIDSRFNRLAIMVTNKTSWHSVSPVLTDAARCCVSNYYFSSVPADSEDYFHVTSFRGRPEQTVRDLVLQADTALRMGVRKIFPKGAVQTDHFYDKDDADKEKG